MSDRRPNRWEAARDPYAAARRAQSASMVTSRAGWSLPVPRALRWLAALVVVLVLYAYGPAMLDALLVWWLS